MVKNLIIGHDRTPLADYGNNAAKVFVGAIPHDAEREAIEEVVKTWPGFLRLYYPGSGLGWCSVEFRSPRQRDDLLRDKTRYHKMLNKVVDIKAFQVPRKSSDNSSTAPANRTFDPPAPKGFSAGRVSSPSRPVGMNYSRSSSVHSQSSVASSANATAKGSDAANDLGHGFAAVTGYLPDSCIGFLRTASGKNGFFHYQAACICIVHQPCRNSECSFFRQIKGKQNISQLLPVGTNVRIIPYPVELEDLRFKFQSKLLWPATHATPKNALPLDDITLDECLLTLLKCQEPQMLSDFENLSLQPSLTTPRTEVQTQEPVFTKPLTVPLTNGTISVPVPPPVAPSKEEQIAIINDSHLHLMRHFIQEYDIDDEEAKAVNMRSSCYLILEKIMGDGQASDNELQGIIEAINMLKRVKKQSSPHKMALFKTLLHTLIANLKKCSVYYVKLVQNEDQSESKSPSSTASSDSIVSTSNISSKSAPKNVSGDVARSQNQSEVPFPPIKGFQSCPSPKGILKNLDPDCHAFPSILTFIETYYPPRKAVYPYDQRLFENVLMNAWKVFTENKKQDALTFSNFSTLMSTFSALVEANLVVPQDFPAVATDTIVKIAFHWSLNQSTGQEPDLRIIKAFLGIPFGSKRTQFNVSGVVTRYLNDHIGIIHTSLGGVFFNINIAFAHNLEKSKYNAKFMSQEPIWNKCKTKIQLEEGTFVKLNLSEKSVMVKGDEKKFFYATKVWSAHFDEEPFTSIVVPGGAKFWQQCIQQYEKMALNQNFMLVGQDEKFSSNFGHALAKKVRKLEPEDGHEESYDFKGFGPFVEYVKAKHEKEVPSILQSLRILAKRDISLLDLRKDFLIKTLLRAKGSFEGLVQCLQICGQPDGASKQFIESHQLMDISSVIVEYFLGEDTFNKQLEDFKKSTLLTNPLDKMSLGNTLYSTGRLFLSTKTESGKLEVDHHDDNIMNVGPNDDASEEEDETKQSSSVLEIRLKRMEGQLREMQSAFTSKISELEDKIMVLESNISSGTTRVNGYQKPNVAKGQRFKDVKICNPGTKEVLSFRSDEEGRLRYDKVKVIIPGIVALKYQIDGHIRIVNHLGEFFETPEDGWSKREYIAHCLVEQPVAHPPFFPLGPTVPLPHGLNFPRK